MINLKKNWLLIFPVLVTMLIGFNYIEEHKDELSSMMSVFKKKDIYEKQIIECQKKYTDVLNNQYSCMFEVFKQAYIANPDRGIELCLKYTPLLIKTPGAMSERANRYACESTITESLDKKTNENNIKQ